MTFGVFGGTFNPIHVGHLRSAEEVCEILGLERMLFVPSANPPHKAGAPGDPMAPADLRLAWARAATAGNARFEVDPLETERDGPSYTVDTLRELGRRVSPGKPVFVIGHDAFVEMGTWRDPETILTLSHLAVTTRPPIAGGTLADWLPAFAKDRVEVAPDGLSARHRTSDTWIRVVEISALDVSASDIRRRIRTSLSVRYLLPEAVHDAVLASGIYDE
jgi:nicotinate-nucleotide adenylyltransferase